MSEHFVANDFIQTECKTCNDLYVVSLRKQNNMLRRKCVHEIL